MSALPLNDRQKTHYTCSLFIGANEKGSDFGDIYGMDKFEALVKDVGRFSGRVYCK